ncbi:MAG: hypothetical protein MUE44_19460 [Oscillatoriaceae cyanobacterium Prado104]|nr:hypothetical protein [Oscillatoriaceae cyanobacterium Prado104]
MKYPLHTVSQPVSGSEVQKLAHALKSGGYVANEAALALAKRIASSRSSESCQCRPVVSLQELIFPICLSNI